MPVRYIGKLPFFKGRSLFELCRQLRDLGVGRVFYRNSFKELRWPDQTTYVRLTKVVPDMTCPTSKSTISEAWGVAVYRGKELGEIKLTAGHKPDWSLVPKEDEASFCQIREVAAEQDPPKTIDCPPLLEMVLKQEFSSKNTLLKSKKIEIPYVDEPTNKEIRRLLL